MSGEDDSSTRSGKVFKLGFNPLTKEPWNPSEETAKPAETNEEITVLSEKQTKKTPFIHILKNIFDTTEEAKAFHKECDDNYEEFYGLTDEDVNIDI